MELSEIGIDFSGPAHRLVHLSGMLYAWEWIGNMEAHYYDTYSFTAATLYDSTAADPGYHYFIVATHTADPFAYWDSAPDSGYSVDNLSPCPPQCLTGLAVIIGLG